MNFNDIEYFIQKSKVEKWLIQYEYIINRNSLESNWPPSIDLNAFYPLWFQDVA